MLKAQLIGNLGNDPETRYSANGQMVLRFNVASNGRRKVGDEWQDVTEWVRVSVFGQRAENLAQYLKKGSRVYVDGRLEARPWTDSRGEMKAGLEVMANEVQFMSSREDSQREPSVPEAHTPRRQPSANQPAEDLENLPF